jgi:hypothetical protein
MASMRNDKHHKLKEIQSFKNNRFKNKHSYIYQAPVLIDNKDVFSLDTFASEVNDAATLYSNSTENIDELICELNGKFDQEKFDALIASCRDAVLNTIVGPFGLSNVLFEDKDGGNVTTLHNARNNLFANDEDKNRFTAEYNRKNYEKNFPQKRKEIFNKNNEIIDAYTGKSLPKDGRTHIDHVVSAKEIHETDENRLFLNQNEKYEITNNDSNLVTTYSSLNQSKGEKKLKEWMSQENVKNEGKNNAERFEVDVEKATKIDEQARSTIKKYTTKKKIKKYSTETLKTSTQEALRMGTQQALGILLYELVTNIFVEIKDIYYNGFSGSEHDKEFFNTLKERLFRVANNVMEKWKDVVEAFGKGAISGFFSNLITVIINAFLSTKKRMVRIIREGFFSLLKAVEILVNPPSGLTVDQAAHEASKLIAAGLAISGGVMIEEFVERSIQSIPVIGIFAGLLSPIIVGTAMGLSTVFIVYLLDKADLFGAIRKEKHNYITSELENMIEDSLFIAEQSVMAIKNPLLDN